MNWAQYILIFGVRIYQWTISPLLATLAGPTGRCRFTPSCSQYALDAIRNHGAFKGSLLAGWRICRCNPWGGCGHDPAPEKGVRVFFREAGKCGEPKQANHATPNHGAVQHGHIFSDGHCQGFHGS